jgi:hypothetical protein
MTKQDTCRFSKAIAFGTVWSSDVPLHAFTAADTAAKSCRPVGIEVRQRDRLPVRGVPLFQSGNGSLYRDGLRLHVRKEACFDLTDGHRIDWSACEDWRGQFPPELFSILAGMSLAMQGQLPLHGSALEIEGRGILLCGATGRGKSTIAAGLTLHGARLISDDLTVISHTGENGPMIYPGRPSIRLFPVIARSITTGLRGNPDLVGHKGKCLVYPATVPPCTATPLQTLVLLEEPGADTSPPPPGQCPRIVRDILFRPNWQIHLPGLDQRLELLRTITDHVRIIRIPTPPIDSQQTLDAICAQLLRHINR